MQFFVNGAVFASYAPRLPEIRDDLGITVAGLGVLLALGSGCRLIGSAATGRVIEWVGTRAVLLFAGLGLVIGLAAIGLASSPVLFLVALGGLQVCDVLVDVSMNLQASWLNDRRHAPVLNRLHGLWSLGTVLGGLSATWIAGAGVSLRTHLLIAAVVFGLVVIMVNRGVLRADESLAAESDAAVDGTRSARRLPLILIGLAGALAIVVEMTSSDWASFRLADDFGAGVGFAGYGFVAFTAGMTTGRLGGDWVQQRIGVARLGRGAQVVALVGLAMATLVPNQWLAVVGYVIAGIGIAPFFPKLYDDAARLPGRPGAGLGAMTAGTAIAMLFSPTLVGALAATSLLVGSAKAIVLIPSIVVFALATRYLDRALRA